MRWWKVLLVLGCIIGAFVLLFGLLGLIGGLTDSTLSPGDRNDTIIGAILFMVLGSIFLFPCVVVLVVTRPKGLLPAWQPGSYYVASPPAELGAYAPSSPQPSQPKLGDSYLQWFGWCQREIGGGEIELHAATMAALVKAGSGDQSGAQQAAKLAAGQSHQPDRLTNARKINGSKVKALSRIGAATLPLLEPTESVMVSFFASDRQAQTYQRFFGIVGYFAAASQTGAYFLTVTDRRLIVLSGSLLTKNPSSVAFMVPRSFVSEAVFQQSWLTHVFRVARVTGERNRFVVNKSWRLEASYAQQLLAPGLVPTPLPPAGVPT